MKIFSILLACVFSFFGSSAHSASGQFSGQWQLVWDNSVDNVVVSERVFGVFMNSHDNVFTAEYTGIDNDSIFEGRTYAHQGKDLIQFIQVDNQFYRIFSGRNVGDNIYQGTWYHGTGSGDFKLELR